MSEYRPNIVTAYRQMHEATASSDDLAALTKLMLSMGASYGEINAVRSKLDKDISSGLLLNIAKVIAGNTSLFNSFVKAFKGNPVNEEALDEVNLPADITQWVNLTKTIRKIGDQRANGTRYTFGDYVYLTSKESPGYGEFQKLDVSRKVLWTVSFKPTSSGAPVMKYDKITKNDFIAFAKGDPLVEDYDITTEEYEQFLSEDKLENDIRSLSKIGWKLDKITKFLITKGDHYDVKMSSDLIKKYYDDINKKPAKPKPYKEPKRPSWPKDPPKSKVKDPSHAEAYLAQAIASEGSVDYTGTEAYQILQHAGYEKSAIMWVIKNMGFDDADFMRQAKRYNWL